MTKEKEIDKKHSIINKILIAIFVCFAIYNLLVLILFITKHQPNILLIIQIIKILVILLLTFGIIRYNESTYNLIIYYVLFYKLIYQGYKLTMIGETSKLIFNNVLTLIILYFLIYILIVYLAFKMLKYINPNDDMVQMIQGKNKDGKSTSFRLTK